ncbi:MAG: DNA adenine methylase [Bacillus sp. (in: Bacteria)]|nr:DNA adenine methylase [Bacillus sp. (in: firmicutes)]
MKISAKDLLTKTGIPKGTLYRWLETYKDFITVEKAVGRKNYYSDKTIDTLLQIKKLKQKGLRDTDIKLALASLKINNTKKNTFPTSPLRFPGSKSRVLKRFYPYFNKSHVEYREPFVGGGSIFFGKDKVSNNWLNDKDPNVYAFFVSMRDYPEQLCKKILQTKPSLELWKEKRKRTEYDNIVDRAFDFLFFNRTNFSGIYTANPLGGMEQNSAYRIDCRWNAETLCKRVLDCSKKLQGVKITNLDFVDVLLAPGDDVLLIIDPPYYKQGDRLYPVSMSHDEHVKLARLLAETKHNFLLTIDDCPEVRNIYGKENFYINQESWIYSINPNKKDRVGKELFISNFKI